MIKACIFDLDGTLAYTLDSMAAVGNQVVRKFGLNPMPVENYRYYCGNGADMLVKRLLIDAGDKELVHYEDQVFDMVMGQSDSIRKKPAPDGPLKIAEAFGVLPEECMYLGDSGTDMQTGKAAGMYTVGVLWGYREKEELLKNGADALVESPEDILDLYEEKCSK